MKETKPADIELQHVEQKCVEEVESNIEGGTNDLQTTRNAESCSVSVHNDSSCVEQQLIHQSSTKLWLFN